ncbi:MAG: DNA-processing protein DprA [Clostridia bacterium]|nr:DNA-processing protein DprA [Clostridia bacterium]
MRELTEDDYGWLYLDSLEDLPLSKKMKVAINLVDGRKVFEIRKHINELNGVLNEKEINLIATSYNKDKIDKHIKETLKKNIGLITYRSEDYPEMLVECPWPPLVLYYVGDVSLLKTKCIAIIGSRISTGYGQTVTELFSKELAINGFTIVSGLAEGLDTVAHKACLDVKGKTIAVLCGGLDKIYPSVNTNLARQIVHSGGLLISENRIGVDSQRFMFPIRNRIIAGLCRGVVLTEASAKSGTRYTIEHALDADRRVYCVPGSILNPRGNYGNQLIKECNSLLVTSPKDVVEDLGLKYKDLSDYNRKQVKADVDEVSQIRAILEEDEYVHFDKILEKSKMDTKKLNSLLTKLELSGIIKKMAGNLYMLRK